MAYITVISVIEVSQTRDELEELSDDELEELGSGHFTDKDAVQFCKTYIGVHELASEEGADV